MAKAQAQEPSMEEILASIRRIIADEDSAPATAASKTPAAPAARSAPQQAAPDVNVSEDELDKLFDSGDDDDVLDLGDSDKDDVYETANDADVDLTLETAAAPVSASPKKIVSPRAEPPKPAAPPTNRRRPPREDDFDEPVADPLISHSTDAMVTAAFDNLALTILNKNARTVEDLIEDLLRPMLRSWLDQNLPQLVERLVKAEIERVARGR